jgi:hypothetical protein
MLLIVAKHSGFGGQEDIPLPVHLLCCRNLLQQDSGRIRVQASGIRPYSHIQVRLEATLSHKWVRVWLLADAATVGISIRRASDAALWLTSIQVPAALAYDFHTTQCKKLLHNRNTSILHS